MYADIFVFLPCSPQHTFAVKKIRVLRPLGNCADRETAACQRSQCQLFWIEGCRVVSAADPTSRNLGFLDRSLL
jgi:hypothetical protein